MNETAETAAQVSDQLYQAVLNRMNITWEPDEKTISIHALLAESDSKSAQNSGALLRI